MLDDAAQGFGATYKNRRLGTFGLATGTSFFPAKPLGCFGDGGAIFTDDEELARTLRSIRVHGQGSDKYDNVRLGLTARLDTMQAAILLEKLKIFDDEIAARNKVAEIMLTEAKPLGFDGDVLVVGHHTGALAERINAEKNNADIAAVLSEKLGAKVQVRCVIGTDPATANLRRPAKREVWNPGTESEATESEDPAPASGWDAPAALGRPQEAAPPKQPPAPQPQPPQPAKREDDWRAAALAASQKAAAKAKQERDEIPPPPEPYDYDEGEPEASIGEEPAYTREDEERDMADQARDEEGSADRRDATEVAMDLLAAELGAKPL